MLHFPDDWRRLILNISTPLFSVAFFLSTSILLHVHHGYILPSPVIVSTSSDRIAPQHLPLCNLLVDNPTHLLSNLPHNSVNPNEGGTRAAKTALPRILPTSRCHIPCTLLWWRLKVMTSRNPPNTMKRKLMKKWNGLITMYMGTKLMPVRSISVD